jgi:hypothetical protein
MQRIHEIHLVGRSELQAAINAAPEDLHPLRGINPQDIVRETLTIAPNAARHWPESRRSPAVFRSETPVTFPRLIDTE